MKAFTNTICLRVAHFSLGVLDIIDGQIELIIVSFQFSAILGASVGENTDNTHIETCHERQNIIVYKVGGSDRCFWWYRA